jgi:hypothetical protein
MRVTGEPVAPGWKEETLRSRFRTFVLSGLAKFGEATKLYLEC